MSSSGAGAGRAIERTVDLERRAVGGDERQMLAFLQIERRLVVDHVAGIKADAARLDDDEFGGARRMRRQRSGGGGGERNEDVPCADHERRPAGSADAGDGRASAAPGPPPAPMTVKAAQLKGCAVAGSRSSASCACRSASAKPCARSFA